MVESAEPRRRSIQAAKGLATLAMLKANFDSGQNHIEMFLPFILDAIRIYPSDDFALEDIKKLLDARHELTLPTATLRTVLASAVRRRFLQREGGRYFRLPASTASADLRAAREAAETEQRRLARVLMEFSESEGLHLSTEEDALALILDFLAQHHVGLLLEAEITSETDSLVTGTGAELSDRQSRVVARFVTERCARSPELLDVVQRMLEGFVLQNALLLRDIGTATRRFSELTVFFDSGFLFEVLGLKGEAAAQAAREAIQLFRETGATVAMFDKTLYEMRRILHVYEVHLGTSDGIASLYPTEITRYVITHRLTPSDIREITSLLERSMEGLGLRIRKMPPRNPVYTLDEVGLTKMIRRPSESDLDPRVMHDVDCIAAVLTLRAGRCRDSYDEARAVFATTTGLLVKHVWEWYRSSGETGVPPVVHQLALSNIAWLKKPASASRLKLHELVALCSAALLPSRKIWGLFLKHLRELQQSGRLTSDEMVAIVASELADSLLSRFDDEVDLDASTITEVVERVRDNYRGEAKATIREVEERASEKVAAMEESAARVEAEAKRTEEELRKVVLNAHVRARTVASLVSGVLFLIVAVLVVSVSVVSVSKFLVGQSFVTKTMGYLGSVLVWALGLAGLLWGGHLAQWRHTLQSLMEKRFRGWLLGQGGGVT